MIVHQSVRKQLEMIVVSGPAEEVKICAVVAVVLEKALLLGGSAGYVV